jgi:hypothetical protein
MTLKYKQAVLIQNLVDATSVPLGQPEETSMKITTQMLIPKQARLTLTNTVVTIPNATAEYYLAAFTLPDRNLTMLGFNMNLTVTKGNAAGGIASAVPISFALGTSVGSDDLMNGEQDTTNALVFTYGKHSNAGTRSYPQKIAPETDVYLYLATDGTPSVNDTLKVTGTLDIYYIDLSKPGL